MAGFLEDAISRHRVRALASGGALWGVVMAMSRPAPRVKGRWPLWSKKRRGQREGSDSRKQKGKLRGGGPAGARGGGAMGAHREWCWSRRVRKKKKKKNIPERRTVALTEKAKAPLVAARLWSTEQWTIDQLPVSKGYHALIRPDNSVFPIMPLIRKNMVYFQTP